MLNDLDKTHLYDIYYCLVLNASTLQCCCLHFIIMQLLSMLSLPRSQTTMGYSFTCTIFELNVQ